MRASLEVRVCSEDHPVLVRFDGHRIAVNFVLDFVPLFEADGLCPVVQQIIEVREEVLTDNSRDPAVDPMQAGEVYLEDAEVVELCATDRES